MMRRQSRRVIGIPLLLAVMTIGVAPACHGADQGRFVKVFLPGGKAVTAELAVTEEERAKGLMFREKLLRDQGMLFVFEKDGTHSFWMKNTLIPLDLLWLDAARRVVYIEAGAPPCRKEPCPTYGPNIPARYVLELKAGSAAAFGIKLYDQLQFALPDGILRTPR